MNNTAFCAILYAYAASAMSVRCPEKGATQKVANCQGSLTAPFGFSAPSPRLSYQLGWAKGFHPWATRPAIRGEVVGTEPTRPSNFLYWFSLEDNFLSS